MAVTYALYKHLAKPKHFGGKYMYDYEVIRWQSVR